MLNPTQLERIRRWSQGIPVDEHEYPSGLALLAFQDYSPTSRDLISSLLQHIREMEQEREHILEASKRAHEHAAECKTTRRDEVARAVLQAILGRPDCGVTTEIGAKGAVAYQWADALERAREDKP